MTMRRFGWVFISWLAAAGLAQAAMYKWVDEQGVTQYTQYPPPDKKVDVVVPPPPPGEDPEGAQKKLEETLKKLDDNRKARLTAEEERQKAADADGQRRKNCDAARGNLRKLTAGGRKRIVGADGVATYMTDEDRAAGIAAAKAQVKKFCSE